MLESARYIKEVPFSSLFNWSVQYLNETKISFNSSYPMVSIGSFLTRNKTSVTIQNEIRYKRATIRVNNGGIFLRDTEIGTKIGTKKQFLIYEGQFLLSKIDARNGAFGVVPSELDGGVITGNFWTFDVDYNKVNPYYLSLVVTTSEFVEFCEQASNGTTNRHYLQESLFLDIKIPLPTIEEQNKLVADYNKKMALAAKQESQASTKEQEIEEYILNRLGVKLDIAEGENTSILKLFSYSDISDRWDLLNGNNLIINSLKKSNYPLVQISNEYEFISRGWNKESYAKTFRYIEIGAISSTNGIEAVSELLTSKAPSRATQRVKAGELIIGTTRPYLKKFAIIQSEYDGDICSSAFQIISSDKNNLSFLNEYLQSEAGIMQFKYYMTGALYPAITNKDLRKILIPLPPIEIQNEIATHISGLKQEIKKLRTTAESNRKTALTNFEQKIY